MGRLVVAVIVILWVIPVSLLVNHIVPEPYMDEIFHIPQAQQYCRGNFKSWDPMITTPPGLYSLSLVHIASLFPGMLYAKTVSSFSEICSAGTLRSINGILAVICSLLVYEILTQLRPTLSERKATLYAVVLSMYPLNWFFTFLYYTDVASLTVVLAMYLACLKQHFQLSALLGAMAIFIRQTNVVWMVFVASTGILKYIMPSNCKEDTEADDRYVLTRKYDEAADHKSMPVGPNLRNRKSDSSSTAASHSKTSVSVPRPASGLLNEVQVILSRLWLLKWDILVSFYPFLVVLLAFLGFVHWNGSVVLGAKEAHAVSPHFAQLMYFGLASFLAMAPFSLSQVATGFVFNTCREGILKLQILAFLWVTLHSLLSLHNFIAGHRDLFEKMRSCPLYSTTKIILLFLDRKMCLIDVFPYQWIELINECYHCSKRSHFYIEFSHQHLLERLERQGRCKRRVTMLTIFLTTKMKLVEGVLHEFEMYEIGLNFKVILFCLFFPWRKDVIMASALSKVTMFTKTMFTFNIHNGHLCAYMW
ncbi:Dol-P-Glc:Glc(2)Man(9)GlcNAc(2)-PP-Dol alpha-1,2-glucosyltransferase [Thalictrum thalictroides]|uniref:Dol-P-Glc:Glc(2)Man(9)GlcNAc(2)-PP-Dol alpha-1,2-glucosyltransferase n=1 Tax=Thalictrum thalictroides TaxID=46969 RepID=A0A7J6WVX7_THATH|nr:Dol-P-Glc:Glc(2)Man(9)GlcNAc(2)-PP-Dol alpha-1,2-glucosyltransferase [Thalictrum thalictroides]